MSGQILTLSQLGWRPYFQQQLTLEDLTDYQQGRVSECNKNHIIVLTEQGKVNLSLLPKENSVCIGDWVLFDQSLQINRVLDRQSLFEHNASGSKAAIQLIAANVDSMMIVYPLNGDFNLNDIKRYLDIAKEAEVEPVVVLTKADLCDNVYDKQDQVQKLNRMMAVYSVNTLDTNDLLSLNCFCQNGQTIAFVGTPNAGKSTLINGLLGLDAQENSENIQLMPQGGLLMNMPKMDELQFCNLEQDANTTFTDITMGCRFGNCTHTSEPGCAVIKAVQSGELEERRLVNHQNSVRNQKISGSTFAEERAKDKAIGKMTHGAIADARSRKKAYETSAY